MTTLSRMITLKEATALRECAKTSGSLSIFLPNQTRVGVGFTDGTPFRLVVKLGQPIYGMTDIRRVGMKLWPRQYFRYGPNCRCCGKRIQDGEKALAFVLNPDGDIERAHWRKAYVHFEECS